VDSRPQKKVTVRMSADMHRSLIDEASRHGVTLNHFICTTLAGAIGWRAGGQVRREEDSLTREARDEAIWSATWGKLLG
jgi:hypothetical protein